jgi:hypothetical protein
MMRNPRRAYDADGKEIPPATIRNLRDHGLTKVVATCHDCGNEGALLLDLFPDSLPVPCVALIAYALASPADRCVVTTEVSKPRSNGKTGTFPTCVPRWASPASTPLRCSGRSTFRRDGARPDASIRRCDGCLRPTLRIRGGPAARQVV